MLASDEPELPSVPLPVTVMAFAAFADANVAEPPVKVSDWPDSKPEFDSPAKEPKLVP